MNGSISDILGSFGYVLKDFGTYWRTAALFRGGNNHTSLCIRKTDGSFIDFGGNKAKGSFKQLLGLIMGNKPEEIKKLLSQLEKQAADFVPKQQIPVRKVYPKSVLMGLLPHWDFYINRGISIDTLKLFEVGLAQQGKLARRYVFPIYEGNDLIGFTGRWHKEEVPENVLKWKHIGRATEWVWPLHLNLEYIKEAGEVILVESPGDVVVLWERGIRNVLCLFTTEMSSKVLKFLISANLKRIIIATNNEPDNKSVGNKAALKIEKKLLKWFDPCRVLVALPPQKDFGDCTEEETEQWKNDLPPLAS